MVSGTLAAYPPEAQGEERTIADRRSPRRARLGLIASVLAILSSVAVIGPVAAAPSTGSAATPRVVIVVGPAGAATDRYRAQAREAAAVARKFTSDVTELYSPNATWPAVRSALQGASVVIYMGHGNGWPSPYRNALYPPTQNGFGLNPSADGDDYDHQYFGEGIVGKQIHLAKDAVVLLHHLCYASGNSEPGVAEGSLDTAKLRVDNFAAGFIRAGASAVLADAYSSPSCVPRRGPGWRAARSTRSGVAPPTPMATRSPSTASEVAGTSPRWIPRTATSGFTRSIVLRAGLTPADVRAGAQGGGRGSRSQGGDPGSVIPEPEIPVIPPTPSLVSSPVRFDSPDIAARPAAGSVVTLALPFKTPQGLDLLEGMQASIRWDVLGLLTPQASPASPSQPDASASPLASRGAGHEPVGGSLAGRERVPGCQSVAGCFDAAAERRRADAAAAPAATGVRGPRRRRAPW